MTRRYIKNRNAAAKGWSVYEGELGREHVRHRGGD